MPYQQGRRLRVKYENWKARSAQIVDETNGTVLYDIDLRNRRPNLTFRSPALGGRTVGTGEFNPWSRKMQAQVNGHSFRIKGKNWKYCDLQWDSAAFGGQTLTWRRKTMWVVLDHILVDENDMPIAKFSPGGCFSSSMGTIELADSRMPQAALDEVVITGMMVMKDTSYYTTQNAVS